jgi:hypothetical protein
MLRSIGAAVAGAGGGGGASGLGTMSNVWAIDDSGAFAGAPGCVFTSEARGLVVPTVGLAPAPEGGWVGAAVICDGRFTCARAASSSVSSRIRKTRPEWASVTWMVLSS